MRMKCAPTSLLCLALLAAASASESPPQSTVGTTGSGSGLPDPPQPPGVKPPFHNASDIGNDVDEEDDEIPEEFVNVTRRGNYSDRPPGNPPQVSVGRAPAANASSAAPGAHSLLSMPGEATCAWHAQVRFFAHG
jgi:hypothetical protein